MQPHLLRLLFSLNSNLKSLPRVPTLLRNHVGTPETIFLYQMPFESRFVPQVVLSCTYCAYDSRWYTRGLSHVPMSLLSRSVPQKAIRCTDCGSSYFWCLFCRSCAGSPLSCTEGVLRCRSFAGAPCPVPRAFLGSVRTSMDFPLYQTGPKRFHTSTDRMRPDKRTYGWL